MLKNHIFVINLKKSTDRREKIKEEFRTKGIDFTFFDAIDGRESPHFIYDDYDLKKRLWLTSGKYPLLGELGCYASHYLLWLKCIELNHPIIICEDDIELNENANEIIKTAFKQVKEYGFLRLESLMNESENESYLVSTKDGYSIRLIKNNSDGFRSYAINPQAAAKLIKHRWCLPVDCFVGANYLHGQFSYQLSPTLVIEHGKYESTIQIEDDKNKTPLYRKPSRELYTLYKKIRLYLNYKIKLKSLQGQNKI